MHGIDRKMSWLLELSSLDFHNDVLSNFQSLLAQMPKESYTWLFCRFENGIQWISLPMANNRWRSGLVTQGTGWSLCSVSESPCGWNIPSSAFVWIRPYSNTRPIWDKCIFRDGIPSWRLVFRTCVVLISCEYEGYMSESAGCVVRFEICTRAMTSQTFHLSNGNTELVWTTLHSSACARF